MRRGLAAVAALLAVAAAADAQPAPPAPPRVTIIGDSVADSLAYVPSATAILRQGIDLNLEIAPCRRLDGDSCPFQGVRPPNAMQVIAADGSSLGSTVIMAVGYNDYEDLYPQEIENALAALKQAGVQRVLWLTLRAAEHPYLSMNDAIAAAAAKHPELTIVDWNVYSRSHPEWFQDDGIHLNGAGTEAMATLIHQALVDLNIPMTPPPTLPVRILTTAIPEAHRGKAYYVRLVAAGGSPPYRWAKAAALPRGLAVSAAGKLTGKVLAKTGTFPIALRVTDNVGKSARKKLVLHVRA
jgi:hypothetical protein